MRCRWRQERSGNGGICNSTSPNLLHESLRISFWAHSIPHNHHESALELLKFPKDGNSRLRCFSCRFVEQAHNAHVHDDVRFWKSTEQTWSSPKFRSEKPKTAGWWKEGCTTGDDSFYTFAARAQTTFVVRIEGLRINRLRYREGLRDPKGHICSLLYRASSSNCLNRVSNISRCQEQTRHALLPVIVFRPAAQNIDVVAMHFRYDNAFVGNSTKLRVVGIVGALYTTSTTHIVRLHGSSALTFWNKT